MKKFLCTLLVALFCITSIPLSGFTIAKATNETTYITKSDLASGYIYFGSYPQSRETNSATISALNAKAPSWSNWTSYGYYSGNGSTMKQGNWMRYTDVTYNGEKYRGVKFTQYRPSRITYPSSSDDSCQGDNSYYTNTIYWFKFETLKWRVLDKNTGLIMCETVIDSQPYSNTIYFNNSVSDYSTENCFNDSSYTNYASDYETSSIRKWLNDDFYNTAFTSADQSTIATTTLNNDCSYTLEGITGYENLDSNDTNDKIFLLSYDEMLNTKYGFSSDSWQGDAGRKAQGSDYAKCQGLWVSTDDSYKENSSWLLRSPGIGSLFCCHVGPIGYVDDTISVEDTCVGIRPALKLNLSSQHTHSYTSKVTAPTCTEKGYTTHTCACGNSYVDTYKPTLGHSWIINADKSYEATCKSKGLNFYNCSRCKETKSEEIPTTDHTWGAWKIITAASCNTDGTKQRVCSVCNKIETGEIPNGGGCKIVSTSYVVPTCTAPGYTSGTYCSVCKTIYVAAKEIPALGHDYETNVVPATTSSKGSKSSVCKNCGDTIIEAIEKVKSVTISSASATYNGKAKTPSITVVDASNNELIKGADFTYSYYLQGEKVNKMVNPGTYTIEVTFMGNYSGTKELNFTIRPGKTSSITAVPTTKGTTKITWKAVTGATGYRIYIHNGKNWKLLKTVTNRTYTITKDYNGKALKMGTQYKICVKAITKEAGGNVIASSSFTSKTFKQIPATVTLKASSSNGKVNLSWTNIAGETGYQIYYSTSKNGTYKKLATTKVNVVKFSNALTKGKTYYFKVRAYTKTNNGNIYGSFSPVVSCKIK